MDSMGYILEDGNIVFGFVSTNEDCSPVNEYEQIIATVKMTFASDCDAEDYITISDNPNLTFAQADYGDGYDDSYAPVESYQDYTGNLYLMTCDVTPELGHSVKGNIVVMTNPFGASNGVAVNGEYQIDIYSDAKRTNLVTSVTSTQSENEQGQKINSYVIEGLTPRTYYATISSEFAVERTDVTIIVSDADISAVPIPIIACDYNKDKNVTAADAITVYQSAANAGNLYCDLNGDNVVTAADATIVYASASAALSYSPITIE